MAYYYGPGAVNDPLYAAAVAANNPLLPVGGSQPVGVAYNAGYGFTPAVPASITPVPFQSAPTAAAPMQVSNTRPTVRRSVNMGFPTTAPSFAMGGYSRGNFGPVDIGPVGYEPVSMATGPAAMSNYAVEDFGAIGGANQAEVAANLASQNAQAAYSNQNPGMFSALSNAFDQPIGTTIENVIANATTPTNLVGSLTGSSLLGAVANKMGQLNMGNLAYDRTMELQGVPGYSTGQIDGQMFSVSPGLFGGQVMSGVVPDWFDIDTAEKMSAVQAGLDPTTGDNLSGFTAGHGGYNSKGQFVDAFGNISAMGSMKDLQTLANQQFKGNIADARTALTNARNNIRPLRLNKTMLDFDDDRGFAGPARGSGGVDEDALSAALAGQLSDLASMQGTAMDQAAFDMAVAGLESGLTGPGPDEAANSSGFSGDWGDYSDDGDPDGDGGDAF